MGKMTKATLERLQEELIKATKEREKWNLAIGEAAGVNSDWHDNAAFDHANEAYRVALAMEESLKNKLADVEIIGPRTRVDKVGIGNTVVVELNGVRQEFTLLGADDSATKSGWISYKTPVGKAIRGKKVGECVVFEVGDRSMEIKVNEIKIGEF